MKPLLVGLHNPVSSDPRMALYHMPRGHAGYRLLEMIVDVDPTFAAYDYLRLFDRENLWKAPALPEGLGRTKALRAEGEDIYARTAGIYDDVVLFGALVWSSVTATGCPAFFENRRLDGTTFWYLPHPSGVNRIYNMGENRRRAGKILLQLAGREVST